MEHYRAYGHYRRRRRNWRSILILVLLSIVGLIGLSAYQPVSALWRAATPPPTLAPTSAFATRAPTPPDATAAGAFSFLATQTVNDVTLHIANTRRDGDYFFLDVCHTKPDQGNWLLRGGTLQM